MKTRSTLALTLVAGLASLASAQIGFQAPPLILPTGTNPSGAAIGDFNGDGKPDIAVTVDGPDRVLTFLGDGVGNFSVGATILVGAGTGAGTIAAADFDGSGTTDLAVALQNVNDVRVWFNNAGLWTPGWVAGVGTNPRGLRVANLDGNASPDLILVGRDDNSLGVLINSGGGFGVSTGSVGTDPRAVAEGDFDGDGDLDLAVVNHDDRTFMIAENTGGTFSVIATFPTNPNERPSGIDAGDLDGDGDIDLAISQGNLVSRHINLGGGAFGPRFDMVTAGGNPGEVRVRDLDGDGDMDIVAANEDSASIATFENTGGGGWGPAVVTPVGMTPQWIATGDLNGDGALDLVVPSRDANNTTILFGEGGVVVPCEPDLTTSAVPGQAGYGVPNGVLTNDDFFYYLIQFFQGNVGVADLTTGAIPGQAGYGVPNGVITNDDFFYYLTIFAAGC